MKFGKQLQLGTYEPWKAQVRKVVFILSSKPLL